MNIYITTDTHFGHKKMIEYCGRPKNFEEIIKKNLKNTLNKDDLLIHLGDVCIGNDKENNLWFETLNCKTCLIRGNHDNKGIGWYLKNGWGFVTDRLDYNIFGKRIALSHYPLNSENDNFDINIHGHFHDTLPSLLKERNKEESNILTKKHKLLALEYTNYKPVRLEKLI